MYSIADAASPSRRILAVVERYRCSAPNSPTTTLERPARDDDAAEAAHHARAAESAANSSNGSSTRNSNACCRDDPVDERASAKVIHIAYELYATEVTYCHGLRTMIDRYMTPLLAMADAAVVPVPKRTILALFANLPEIARISTEFLASLEARLFSGAPRSAQRGSVPRPKEDMKWTCPDGVSDVLLAFLPYFKVYSAYAGNFDAALTSLSQLLTAHPPLADFLKSVDPNPALSLQSLMILPVQRLPRYRLLLLDLVATTSKLLAPSRPPSPYTVAVDGQQQRRLASATRSYCPPAEVMGLTRALSLVDDVAAFVNEGVRRAERAAELIDVQRRLVGFHAPLMAPTRRLLHTGPLVKVSRRARDDRFVLLFTDLLMLTSPIAPTQRLLLHHRTFPLNEVSVAPRDAFSNAIEVWLDHFDAALAVLHSATALKSSNSASIRALGGTETSPVSSSWWPWSASSPTTAGDLARQHVPRSTPIVTDYRAPVWIPDAATTACNVCRVEFTLTNRRHHCRLCGHVVCGSCSGGAYVFRALTATASRDLRCCQPCFRRQLTVQHLASVESERFDEIMPRRLHECAPAVFGAGEEAWFH
ncbi:hypothetical protein H9P43_002696 [Blastocladiella emersonii ATCC 22665]|nr:hypothetical protein H9P43_002696 [Blastocladiella emersonii ATCC 22665]